MDQWTLQFSVVPCPSDSYTASDVSAHESIKATIFGAIE